MKSLGKNPKDERKIFKRIVLFQSNSIYDNIAFVGSILRALPDLKGLLSEQAISVIQFMENMFYSFLKKLDSDFFEKTRAVKHQFVKNLNPTKRIDLLNN